MNPKTSIFFTFLLSLTSCMSTNYSFADRQGELPDIQTLEVEHQRLQSGSQSAKRGLRNVAWLPLVALRLQGYEQSKSELPAGTTYTNVGAVGPVGMLVNAERLLYDEQQKLYERNLDTLYFWGIYKSTRTDVRVPAGWRTGSETSLLFGLLSWPDQYYQSSSSFDLERNNGAAAKTES